MSLEGTKVITVEPKITTTGGPGNDKIIGSVGDDILTGGAGNDILDGGKGDDTLQGGAGSDQYLYALGYGHDTISADAANISDTIVFGKGITAAMLSFGKDGDNLVIGLTENDSLTVEGWFANTQNQVTQFKFADGSVYKYGNQGSTGNDILVDLAGSNSLTGLAGNDILYGKDGNDVLDGGAGADIALGGEGNDTILYDAADTVDGGAGVDFINASGFKTAVTIDLNSAKLQNIENVIGGAGNDKLVGNASANILTGGLGNDILDGGKGDDTLLGGAGSDQYLYGLGYGHDTISADAANNSDTIVFGKGITAAMLSFSQAGDNLVISLNENDSLTVEGWFANAQNQVTQFKFADGNVYKYGTQATSGSDILVDLTGSNSLTGQAGNDILYGKDGNDVLDGGAGADIVLGGEGNDTILYDAADTVDGGADIDTINASVFKTAVTIDLNSAKLQNIENVIGGAGNDKLVGNASANILISGAGNDILDGGKGDDTLKGGAGADQYLYGLGYGHDTISADALNNADTIIFGKGITAAMLSFSQDGDNLVVTLSENDSLTVEGWFADTQNQVTQFKFADGSVYKYGTQATIGNDILVDLTGSNSLTGLAGNDILYGKDGNDVLDGGAGADIVLGGEGNDTMVYDATDTVDGGAGVDVINASGFKTAVTIDLNSTKLQNIENVIGGAGNDKLVGNVSANILTSGAGNDILDGGKGEDTLQGGAGNDQYLYGVGYGHDTISADVANNADTIVFGKGITASMLSFSQDGSDLVISLTENDSLTVEGWFASNQNQVTQFKFADGSVYKYGTQATVGNDILVDLTGSNSLTGLAGNDILYGKDGNDVLDGGAGADIVLGGEGDDTFVYDAADTADGGFGVDVINASNFKTAVTIDLSGTKLQNVENIIGGAGSDKLVGNASANVLTGGAGSDILDGGKGDDTLTGGAGSDQYIYGLGYGNDIIKADLANNTDTIVFGKGITLSMLTMSRDGDNQVIRLNSNDTLTIEGWYADDKNHIGQFRFADGSVYKCVTNTGSSAMVDGTNGKDLIITGDLGDNIYSWGGDDVIFSGEGNDTINTMGGKDIVYSGAGDDNILYDVETKLVDGGAGIDIIDGMWQTGALSIDFNKLNGRYVNVEGFAGGFGNDKLYGDAVGNWLIGNQGNDTIVGGAGNDTLDGGDGNDVIDGGAGNDTIALSDGPDRINGGDGVDILDATHQGGVNYTGLNLRLSDYTNMEGIIGTSWNDTITGTSGDDVLSGYYGDDILIGAGGNDILDGGAGYDTYVLNRGFGHVTVRAGSSGETIKLGYDPGEPAFSQNGSDLELVFSNGEQITIQGWYDHLQTNKFEILTPQGTSIFNLYVGGAGSDRFIGSAVDDHIYGMDGNDSLAGGLGNDLLQGGRGTDSYVFEQGFGQDTIVMDSDNITDRIIFKGVNSDPQLTRNGNDLVLDFGANNVLTLSGWYNGAGYQIGEIVLTDQWGGNPTVIRLSETMIGTPGSDFLMGGNDNDLIAGQEGNDQLFSGDGDDWVLGGNGNDQLLGEKGNDRLNGGTGNDTLVGGLGDDILTGGTGADTFCFDGGYGNDTIADCNWADGDIIQLGNNLDFFSATCTDLGNRVSFTFHNGSGQDDTLVINRGSDGRYNVAFDIDGMLLQFGNFRIGTDADDSWWSTTAGNDYIDGRGGDDILYGGDGNDYILGGAGNDHIGGDNGNDLLFGGSGSDVMYGGAGNDILDGGAGADSLYGGDGDDIFLYDSADYFNGGDGIDGVNAANQTANLNIDMSRFYGIEGFMGGRGNDTITGNDLDNILDGGYGVNRLDGGAGNDILYNLDGVAYLSGGDGDDIYDVSRSMLTRITNNDIIGHDVLRFDETVDLNSLAFDMIGNDLVIYDKSSSGLTECVRFVGWNSNGSPNPFNQIDALELNDITLTKDVLYSYAQGNYNM